MSGSHVPEQLQRSIAQALDQPGAAIRIEERRPLTHQSNRLYDAWAGDRQLIVKEFLKPDELHDAPLREARALELVVPLDIAPRLVLLQPSATPALGPVVVYEWMAGEMWERRRPSSQQLVQLADTWLALHALPTEGLWMSRGYERSLREHEARLRAQFLSYAGWVSEEFPAGTQAVDLVLDLMERRREVVAELECSTPVLRFCRGDARFANVIQRPDGRLGLVDWEDSGLRDPARDVADLLTAADQEDVLDWGDWQAFLHPYLQGRYAVDPTLARRVELYLAMFPILWLVVLASHGLQRARRGELAGWTTNTMAPNQRLRRYLARALAWPEMELADQLAELAEVTFFPDTEDPG